MGAPRAVTVTANPAVDRSATCERVVPERKLRCGDVSRDPGGGGVNVARAMLRLGGAATAVIAAGGFTGERLASGLLEEGVPHAVAPIAEETRENLTVFERGTGSAFRFGMPGCPMSGAEADALLEAAEGEAAAGDFLVGSGSLPPGAPPDLYARLAEVARRRGARCVVDTSGDALRRALDGGGLYLLKPNFREMGEYAGRELRTEEDAASAAGRLVEDGTVEMVLVTLGAGGAVLVTSSDTVRIAAPAVPVRSRIGAGDSTVAGMLAALARGWDAVRAARYAVAAGAAAVMTPGTELCRKDDTDALFACIEHGERSCGAAGGMNRGG
ncbi:MAG: 1-phosphofructokinase family hexose kinase [Coriobacteriia bacterium]|nr:1-phosphofructokinase family hexose kinase [Coriobacteriia bacterium]